MWALVFIKEAVMLLCQHYNNKVRKKYIRFHFKKKYSYLCFVLIWLSCSYTCKSIYQSISSNVKERWITSVLINIIIISKWLATSLTYLFFISFQFVRLSLIIWFQNYVDIHEKYIFTSGLMCKMWTSF